MENYLESEKRAAWLASPARKAAIEEAHRRCAALRTEPEAAATGEQRQARTFEERLAAAEDSPLLKAVEQYIASGA